MKSLFNKLVALYLERRYSQIEYYMNHPFEVQRRVLRDLVKQGRLTEFGNNHNFSKVRDSESFAKYTPLANYENLSPLINRMMLGEADVLWPGTVKWFAKSSGTTNDKSKFIPVSKENLNDCHLKSSWDVVTLLYHINSDSRVFSDKNLIMGGSVAAFPPHSETRVGDISGVMLENMPIIGRPFYTPNIETALLADFDEKLERMVEMTSKENVVMFGGVPSWLIVLFNKILDYTGKSNMLEVWPEVQAYVHGGVGFDPYRQQFKKYLPTDDFTYLEVYNASEGYFGIQSDGDTKDLLLLLDNGVYYEFIPMTVWGTDSQYAIPLEGVEIGINYALVISTNSGLWRYQPGDTIKFTNKSPYKFEITGRTKHFINVFGEELMVSNTDKALAAISQEFGVDIAEYTVAPIFMDGLAKGGHEWIVEFADNVPHDIKAFAKQLDLKLQSINSDYEAKRYQSLALQELKINVAPKNTFIKWLDSRGKMGAQNKVPRLSNSRKHLEGILNYI